MILSMRSDSAPTLSSNWRMSMPITHSNFFVASPAKIFAEAVFPSRLIVPETVLSGIASK